MNATPRLQSSFPMTPTRSPQNDATPIRTRGPLPASHTTMIPRAKPLIPTDILDAPTQRLYVLAAYGILLAWRLYDFSRLVEDETESFWLFLKWVAIDSVFLYGLPGLRIPWLEWEFFTISVLFSIHALLNGMLMFRIPIPIGAWIVAFTKVLFDSELSVSDTWVKPSSILHNSSLIMGRQIINILPEGSAILNPDRLPFCIDRTHPTVNLPIRINQTTPVLIELLRLDFESNANETIEIKGGAKLLKDAKKAMKTRDPSEPMVLEYTVKKPGLYRLQRVVDETKMEVQRRMSDTLVVECPTALVHGTEPQKCMGELSDLTIDVRGTPPMKISYSRTINRKEMDVHTTLESIQPEDFLSPLIANSDSGALVPRGQSDVDVSWGRSVTVPVRLNESMTTVGDWTYSIDEVRDAVGNSVSFTARGEDGERIYPKNTRLDKTFKVLERPLASFDGCDLQNPIRVGEGMPTQMPIRLDKFRTKSSPSSDTEVTWKFSPIDTLTASGEHGDGVIIDSFNPTDRQKRPAINRAGLYTLSSVTSQGCEGQIREPDSCMLINPPKPDLSLTSENIFDKCAGSSIGLVVDLDLTGSPPFVVRYEQTRKGGSPQQKSIQVAGLRHQLEFKPEEAGHYTYRFTTMDDHVYVGIPISSDRLTLEQDVKPPASAHFASSVRQLRACIEEPVEADIQLQGEAPFTLEYEIVHNGKRKKQKITDIESNYYTIATDPLTNGGEYTLSLASVQDKTGCKIFLKDEIKINVRRQRPKVAFGQVDGKYSVVTLEGKNPRLPLKLSGQAPWSIKYQNFDDPSHPIISKELRNTNDNIQVDQRGTYEIIDVSDSECPGTVDKSASTFKVDWIPRPEIRVTESTALTRKEDRYIKQEVCEGDVDVVEAHLSGTPPYRLKYTQRLKERASMSVKNMDFNVALGTTSINMDTNKPGTYEYKFTELSDSAYDHEPKRWTPLIIEQKVNPRPTAQFSKPGQSYSYCKEESEGDEVIPITLTGLPPFSLEIDIKHQSSVRPETVKIANIETTEYEFRIPRRVLSLGTHHVSVRKVRDARGCQQKTEYERGGPHVQVRVFDVPTIYPLESQTDFCVGERISYTLSGTAPFEIYYEFEGIHRKARSSETTFRRIAEKPGNFTITGISDKASDCKAKTDITKVIHELPSVRISQGRQVEIDIHEGGEAELVFDFWGTPPFEFTYTRSSNAKKDKSGKVGHGKIGEVLETRHEVSHEHQKRVRSSLEGTYEVVAIKDRYCAFSTQSVVARGGEKRKLLEFW